MRILQFHIRKLLIFTIIFEAIFFSNCRYGNHNMPAVNKIEFPPTLDTIYSNDEYSSSKVCYYFEGNCSSCLITLNRISQDYDTCEIIGITPSSDTVATVFLCEQSRLKALILFDKDSSFFRQNEGLMNIGNLFLIDKEGIVEDLSSDYSF